VGKQKEKRKPVVTKNNRTIGEQIESLRNSVRDHLDRSQNNFPDDKKAEYILDLFDQFEVLIMKRERKQAQMIQDATSSKKSVRNYWFELTIHQLESRRKSEGMSQADIAELVGVRPDIYSGWINGKVEPNRESRAKVVEAVAKIIRTSGDDCGNKT